MHNLFNIATESHMFILRMQLIDLGKEGINCSRFISLQSNYGAGSVEIYQPCFTWNYNRESQCVKQLLQLSTIIGNQEIDCIWTL